MRRFIDRIWSSPTLMTWGSFFSRTIGVLLVMPLTLTRMDVNEIVVWYLFTTIFSLLWILDLGFGSTASRAISYAVAGAPNVGQPSAASDVPLPPNSDLLSRIVWTLRWVYAALATISLLILSAVGTWALLEPVAALSDSREAWLAWLGILIICPVTMWGTQYAVYLEGINKVALSRRWDMVTGLASSASMALALHFHGGLLALVICYQGWALLRIVIFRLLCSRFGYANTADSVRRFDRDTFHRLWSGAWRSGVGGVMSYGLVGVAAFMVAHADEPAIAASYLVSSRLLDALLQFSQAPFYGKLPLLVKLRAAGNVSGLISAARRGMFLGYWCFIAGFLGLALCADTLLGLIGSRASFASPALWALMGLATFIQFYGAMHIQLYSTTDHIIWHVANTVAAALFIAECWIFLPVLGVYAVPAGWLCGYAGFYAWYSARHAYRSIDAKFWPFERRLALPAIAIMVFYGLFAFLSSMKDFRLAGFK